ncbi:MAG: hypothetical protein H6581_26265 [Bacteroidia bacterium]|nr:hypothetical protein [Bacteroidia bacterium]
MILLPGFWGATSVLAQSADRFYQAVKNLESLHYTIRPVLNCQDTETGTLGCRVLP